GAGPVSAVEVEYGADVNPSSVDCVIAPLQDASVAGAAVLLAGSMRDNPLHLAVFGDDQTRLEPLLSVAFARLLRRQMRAGHVLAAYEGDALAGVAAMVAPGRCGLPVPEQLAMFGVLARGGALHRLPRVARWLQAWKRHDPRFDHWHLGPEAVVRTRQGRGIGSRLMQEVCARLDRSRGIGYLETDKPENVRL